MKKIKGFIILIIILGVYGLILFFAFGNKEDNNQNDNNNNNNSQQNIKNKEDKYIVVGNFANLNYSHGLFSKAKVKKIEKIEKYKVYVNNKYYGDYKLKSGGNWNLFDKNDEYINYNGNLLAYSSNFNVKVRNNYKIREIDEKDKVFLINSYNLSTFSNLTINQAIDIDLDNNGEDDEIICLSSMEESNNDSSYYNIFVIKLNNEVTTLIEEREDDAKYVYSIFGIINIEDSKNDSIIIKKVEGYYSENPKVSSLISNYKNDKYMID